MDSQIVTREIKSEIWPLLRANGFTRFTGRGAWRYRPEQIHVVNFQSFNSYLATAVGSTTFSFALNLGIYFRMIPMHYPVRGVHPSVRPQEYHCHFRNHLTKSFEQPEFTRRDIWYVAPDGGNVLEVLADARTVLTQDGLPWFDKFVSLEEVLRLLISEDSRPPIRKHMIGHIARALGRNELADAMIAEAERELEAIRRPVKRRS